MTENQSFYNAPSSSFINYFKYFFAQTTDRADPVFREIFERCPRSDTVIRIACFRIIDVTAGFTFIRLHLFFLLTDSMSESSENMSVQAGFSGFPETVKVAVGICGNDFIGICQNKFCSWSLFRF